MAHDDSQRSPVIGASVPRLEDVPLVTGRGLFAADVSFPDSFTCASCARRSRTDGSCRSTRPRRAAAPGVVAVWTIDDIADLPPIDFRDDRVEPLMPYRQPLLARARVRYVGEPVAVVFADDPYQAEDAAEQVTLDIEALPPCSSTDGAPGEFAPGLSDRADGDRARPMATSRRALRAAHAIVALDLSIGRHSGVPLETRGAIARYDAARDVLELHGAAKVPHRNREQIAKILSRPLASVHLFEGHVGGGFGVRGELYPEDVLVCLAALRLGRPVKWIEDRREHFIAANHSRQQRHHVRAAVDADGRILGIEDEFFHDQGAYVRTHGARVVDLTAGMLPGPYRVPAYRAAGHFGLTNKTPAATYRSPGRYESTFVRERLIDAIAQRLGIDRDRGAPPQPDRPERDAVRAAAARARRRGRARFRRLCGAARQGARRASTGRSCTRALPRAARAGEAVGAGLAMFVEKSGLGPPDGVRIAVEPSGEVEVVTGGASVGQGFETVMAQICADALGVDYRRVRVVHGQTDRIAHGIGAHAHARTVMTGSATHVAALKVRAQGARGGRASCCRRRPTSSTSSTAAGAAQGR